MTAIADPLVAVVLPPLEGFGPGRAGAIGLLTRRLLATQGFHTVIVSGPQAGPVYPSVEVHQVRPAWWWPGNLNLRFAAAIAPRLQRLAPAVIEVHNRPEIALHFAHRMPGVPVILVLHNDPQSMRAARSPAERARLVQRLALVVTCSAYLRARFLESLDVPANAVAVLPNCIDLAELPPSRPKENLILFVGRVVAEKGTDMFAAACAAALPHLPGWRAEIIGADRSYAASPETDFVRRVRAVARDAGIGMTGYRDHPHVLEAMARAAIVVVPSRWPEPFGLTALEALASGAALIASPRGGLREVGGDVARYADPDDPDALAEAILQLARDTALREALGAAGPQRARQFDVSTTAARLAALRRGALARVRARLAEAAAS